MAGERYEEFRDLAAAELAQSVGYPTDGRVAMLRAARAAAYAELAKAEAFNKKAEEDR